MFDMEKLFKLTMPKKSSSNKNGGLVLTDYKLEKSKPLMKRQLKMTQAEIR